MDVRSALAQRVNERFIKLRTALDTFDDESAERVLVGPKWNIRDLVGHLLFWTDDAANFLRLSSTAAPPSGNQRDAVNEEVYRRNRRMSFVMLLPQLREAQQKFLVSLQSVPVEQLIGEAAARTVIDEGVIAHYDHHLEAIRAATVRKS